MQKDDRVVSIRPCGGKKWRVLYYLDGERMYRYVDGEAEGRMWAKIWCEERDLPEPDESVIGPVRKGKRRLTSTASQRSIRAQIDTWKPPDGRRAISERLAFLLKWAREALPGVVIPYRDAAKAVFQLPSRPQDGNDSPHVVSIRQSITAARRRCQSWGFDVLTVRGEGLRATVDDVELSSLSVTRDTARYRGSSRALMNSFRLIDFDALEDQIADLPEEIQEEYRALATLQRETVGRHVRYLEEHADQLQLPEPAGD